MEISKLEDLIPYKASLKELYQQEEFQILLSFLSSLRKQKEAEIFNSQAALVQSSNGKTDSTMRTELAVMIAQRNIAAMIENLPLVVHEVQATLERQKLQAEAFKKSQQ